MAGDVLHPLQVCRRDGLLHELDVQPLVLHLVQDADGLLGVPGLVRVDADADLSAHCLADCGQPGHIQFRVDADLDLQAVVPAGDGGAGIPRHLLRRIHADGDVGDDVLPGTAQHPVDWGVVLLAQQVPQCHIHRSLCAGVVDEGLLHGSGQVLELVDVMAEDGRGDVVLNGPDDGPGRVAGDDAGGRCLTVAHGTGVGVELHDDVLDAVDGAQCRFERHPQRGGNAAQPHLRDLHTPILLIPAAGWPV